MTHTPPTPIITPAHWRRFGQLSALVRSLNGVGPTVRQCAEAWGIASPGHAHKDLARLADLGLIRKLTARKNAVELCPAFKAVDDPDGQRLIPLWPERAA
jgi:hypothetical protein